MSSNFHSSIGKIRASCVLVSSNNIAHPQGSSILLLNTSEKLNINTFCHLLYLNYAIVLLDTRMLKALVMKKNPSWTLATKHFFFITCGCNLDFPTSCGCQATPYLQILIFSRTVFYVCVIFSTDKRLISSFSTTFRKIQ